MDMWTLIVVPIVVGVATNLLTPYARKRMAPSAFRLLGSITSARAIMLKRELTHRQNELAAFAHRLQNPIAAVSFFQVFVSRLFICLAIAVFGLLVALAIVALGLHSSPIGTGGVFAGLLIALPNAGSTISIGFMMYSAAEAFGNPEPHQKFLRERIAFLEGEIHKYER